MTTYDRMMALAKEIQPFYRHEPRFLYGLYQGYTGLKMGMEVIFLSSALADSWREVLKEREPTWVFRSSSPEYPQLLEILAPLTDPEYYSAISMAAIDKYQRENGKL
jgi:hypothetical protein